MEEKKTILERFAAFTQVMENACIAEKKRNGESDRYKKQQRAHMLLLDVSGLIAVMIKSIEDAMIVTSKIHQQLEDHPELQKRLHELFIQFRDVYDIKEKITLGI